VKVPHSSRTRHLGISLTTLPRPLDQPSQTQIIDDILNPLDIILDRISTLPEDIVLEVQQLEAGEEVLYERTDDEWKGEVAEGDAVGGQAGEVTG
jgi:hypothetical protein